jgi:predicted alpha/beta-hydrolase family hydrolase
MTAPKIVSEYEFSSPRRATKRPDRAVLLAHGAGADMHAAALVVAAAAFADAGIATLRWNYPYMTAGKKAPDRAPVLLAATREAAIELVRRTKLPVERIVLGGRSMGGRYCSLLAGDTIEPWPALGLVLQGYPLHAPGRPDKIRDEHFPRLTMPVLFVSGTNDQFGTPDELRRSAKRVGGRVAWHWIPTADHGFKPKKRESGLSVDDALASMAEAMVAFVAGL